MTRRIYWRFRTVLEMLSNNTRKKLLCNRGSSDSVFGRVNELYYPHRGFHDSISHRILSSRVSYRACVDTSFRHLFRFRCLGARRSFTFKFNMVKSQFSIARVENAFSLGNASYKRLVYASLSFVDRWSLNSRNITSTLTNYDDLRFYG